MKKQLVFYVFAKSTMSSSKLIFLLKTLKHHLQNSQMRRLGEVLELFGGINLVIFGASLAFLAFLLALFACNFGRLSRQDPSREAFFMKFELPRPFPRGTPSLFQASCKPLPSLQAPSLQAPSLQWPRRVTRSANNPPAHPLG